VTPADTLERLDRAVALGIRLGASDVEVSHVGRTLGMARFASSAITQSGVAEERTTRIRVAVGDRLGAATTSDLDDAALEETAALAIGAAKVSPPTSGFSGFARPSVATRSARPTLDAATTALGPDERADVLARLFRRATRDGLVLAGSYQTGPRIDAVATAAGVRLGHQASFAQLAVIAMDGPASGHASAFSSTAARIDADLLADEACATAVRARSPIDLAPGAYDVVLAPAAVAELLEWLAIGSFSARAVIDGTSFLAGAAGRPLFDERLTLVDDAAFDHPDLTATPFDAEGSPRARVVLVDRGRAGAPVSDLATAARIGAPSTGHASPLGALVAEGPEPAALVLLPGPDGRSELVGRVERGLYVTRFHYVNGLLDTRRAVMTGMTRDGLFAIRDGQLGQAVTNLRFTESILDAFGRLGGVGDALEAHPGSWVSGTTLCPALLLRDFHFTGKSR
jgi:PmbA protein